MMRLFADRSATLNVAPSTGELESNRSATGASKWGVRLAILFLPIEV